MVFKICVSSFYPFLICHFAVALLHHAHAPAKIPRSHAPDSKPPMEIACSRTNAPKPKQERHHQCHETKRNINEDRQRSVYAVF